MSNRYAPLPNPQTDPNAAAEMEAAFDYSDDEDDFHNASESHPLNPVSAPPIRSPPAHIPGTYNFETVDYDYPPPGSPPRPSAVALPNEHGNSNGFVPQFDLDSNIPAPNRGWFRRTAAAVLPSHYVQRFGFGSRKPIGTVGGGTNNDGVFANVTAKPTAPIRIQDGDETYVVPEDARAEAPPSYASAQADSVPPYWETIVHAPFSPDSIGEMIIDSLPTGSLFSFFWNMLVSISFQFVGFLLTYLLHTTHAARLGSRAGLGITLIQYGFALRTRFDGSSGGPETDTSGWGWKADPPRPTFATATEAEAYYNNSTIPGPTDSISDDQVPSIIADATSEWLSFFLMTVGWFILLTSLLGFWRVKRWERGILASQRETNSASAASTTRNEAYSLHQLHNLFGLGDANARRELLRHGFGFGGHRRSGEEAEVVVVRPPRTENGTAQETEHMISQSHDGAPHDSEREARLAAALEHERLLQSRLRAAGVL
ncbi:hypothetical protein BD779DRAFT_1432964 [Infundibulicybe gibba]|nr:hypothetical protein BD779DRAFT_1432964 [Infundibulicybe gibba]